MLYMVKVFDKPMGECLERRLFSYEDQAYAYNKKREKQGDWCYVTLVNPED